MKKLIESIDRYLSEGKAKRVRKGKMKKRRKTGDEKAHQFNQEVYRVLKANQNEIVRLFNAKSDWDVSGNVRIASRPIEDGLVEFDIKFDQGFAIAQASNGEMQYEGEAFFSVYVYAVAPHYNGVEVSAGWIDMSPLGDDASASSGKLENEVYYEISWKQGRKPFNPEKDLMPLIRQAMIGAINDLPYYDEWEEPFDPERDAFGPGGFARWSNPSMFRK